MAIIEKKSKEELELLIGKAIKKIQGVKENDLCKYLPGPSGGYIHHFTLRKLKQSDPTQLFTLLKQFVIENDNPSPIKPKSRAPRGSRKQWNAIKFTRNDIEKILELATKTGDQDLLTRFNSTRSLASLKKELIRSIRSNQIEQTLWNAYVAILSSFNEQS